MQHHIFVSYSRRDSSTMRRIRNDLETACLRVWTDEGIDVGTTSWKEAIESAILQAEIVLVMMSPSANDSIWVQREIDFAELHDKKILPVLVRGEPRDAIPFALSGVQYIDLRRKYQNGIRRLVKRISTHMQQDVITLPTRRVQRKSGLITIFGLVATIAMVIIGIVFLLNGLNFEGGVTFADNPSELTLYYDSDALILVNTSNSFQNIMGLGFTLYEGGKQVYTFSSNEWNLSNGLPPNRCTQIWGDDVYRAHVPKDLCIERLRYFSSFRQFWVSDVPTSHFQIWRGGQHIGRCEVVTTTDDDMQTCELFLEPALDA